MEKKFIALFVLFVLWYGVPSCGILPEDCKEVPKYFNITGLKIGNSQVREKGYGGRSNWQYVEDGKTIPFEEFYMRASFEVEYFSGKRLFKNFNLSNKAYASGCPEAGQNGSKEKLDTLYIITNNDFNEKFSAGDTINEIVEIHSGNVSFFNDLQRFKPLMFYFYMNNKENIVEEDFCLKMNQEPTFKDLRHSFTLIYKLQNGEVYTAKTETVKFE